MLLSILVALAGLSAAANPMASLFKQSGNRRPATYEAHTIDMPIDHFPDNDQYAPHTTATFKQRYYFDDTYYKPGGPVFLYIGGETGADTRLSNLQTGIIQILMKATNGLGVILENRYYGTSQPFNTSTTDQLRFHTTEQTIADNAYFARHVRFPGVRGNLNALSAPWILYGGSLAGAQVAFSLVEYEGLLWGGIGSSGVIHTVHTYPEWYSPIQKYGPQDCIANINSIVDNIDRLIDTDNIVALQKLKDVFGLGALSDLRDFALTISWPIGNPLTYPTHTWQELNWYPSYSHPDFYWFCNNVTNADAPADITAVDYDLADYTDGKPWTGLGNYAHYIKQVIVSTCPSPDLINTSRCFSTQNQSHWADPTNSADRAYLYSTCTEQGYYIAAPATGPSLLSRVIEPSYTQQWCDWAFPAGQFNAIPVNGPDVSRLNKYGDLNLSAPRLALIDGSADVWNDVCYHSSKAPPRSGEHQYLIPGGGHHWDSHGILNTEAEPDHIRAAHEWEIRLVKKWVKEFHKEKMRVQYEL